MTRILFVCLGNICRSPMAEYVMKQMLREAGLAEAVTVASAATSREEEGNDVYPPARRTLLAHGVPCPARASTPLTGQDYAAWDRIIGMEPRNLADMHRLFGGDPQNKLRLLLHYAGEERGIADPWYTGDFETTYEDVCAGCAGLLERLTQAEHP